VIASISVPSFTESFDADNGTMINAEIAAQIKQAVNNLRAW